MFKYLSLFTLPKPKPRKPRLIRELRRLAHERSYWRNSTKEIRRRGKR